MSVDSYNVDSETDNVDSDTVTDTIIVLTVTMLKLDSDIVTMSTVMH